MQTRRVLHKISMIWDAVRIVLASGPSAFWQLFLRFFFFRPAACQSLPVFSIHDGRRYWLAV